MKQDTAILRDEPTFLDPAFARQVQTIRFLGLRLHCLTYGEMHEAFDWWLSDKSRPSLTVAAINVNCCVSAIKDQRMLRCYRAADIRGIDSMPFLRLARFLTRRQLDRLYAPDMMLEVAKRGTVKNYRFFLMGGMPGAADTIAEKLLREYPGIQIAGTSCPPFRALTSAESSELVEKINSSAPDFVWIGLGSPKQDLWIQEHKEKLRGCVVVASGATFDFFSGRIRQAPPWIRKIGFEWLFRLFQDFRRLWKRYTIYNLLFAYNLVLELTGLKSFEQ